MDKNQATIIKKNLLSQHVPPQKVELAVWDNLPTTGYGKALLIYRDIPDIKKLECAIEGAIALFPSFAGRIRADSDTPYIITNTRGMEFEVRKTEQALLEEIPPKFEKILAISTPRPVPFDVNSDMSLFGLTLLINEQEKSSALIWQTCHAHADGNTIFRFLACITCLYKGENSDDKENLQRTSYFDELIRSVPPAENRLTKLPFIYDSDHKKTITLENGVVRLFSLDEKAITRIKASAKKHHVSAHKILLALVFLSHSKSVDIEGDLFCMKLLDFRRYNVVPLSYSGNALIGMGCYCDSDYLGYSSISEVIKLIEKQATLSNTEIMTALAWYEAKRISDPSPIVTKHINLERIVRVNDLRFMPAQKIDLAGKPIWYDQAYLPKSNTVHIYPELNEKQWYLRVTGLGPYINRFEKNCMDLIYSL